MSEIDDVLGAARECRERDEPFALATVVAVRGSSYRRPGARLLVPLNGAPVGLISGGCLEGEAARLTMEAVALGTPVLVTIDHSTEGDEVWGTGLGCRGVIDLLAEPPRLAADTIQALDDARSRRVATCLLTGLDGTRQSLTPEQASALDPRAAGAVARGHPIVLDGRILDPVLPPLQLVVCGAGQDAGPMVAAGLRLGWQVDVVDPRRALLDPHRFAGARLVRAEPREAAEAVDAGPWTAVVIMSHDYLRDAEFLSSFLGRGVSYLGILGPRDRTERLLAELASEPNDSDRAVMHAPAGIDIGADGSEQVATSIAAEILAVRHGRSGRSLRHRAGAIHG